MNDERIILEVKKRPALYDTNNKLYKNNMHRRKVWINLAADLNLPVKLCMTRWKRLRDRYQRYRKLCSETGSDSNTNHLIKKLDFLKPAATSNTRKVANRSILKSTSKHKLIKIAPARAMQNDNGYELSTEDEHIIYEVKKRPLLYNANDKLFKNNTNRKKMWREVAVALDLPVEVCMTKWKKLEDRYQKNQKQRNIEATDLKTWPLTAALSFLSPCIPDDDMSNTASCFTQTKTSNESLLQDLHYITSHKLDRILETINNPVQVFDGLDHYGLALASELRNMEPSEQRRAKLEIASLLASCEYKN